MKTEIKIKLCGMMRDCDIDFANAASPDYVGFVCANTRRKIDKETARNFRGNLNREIKAVGVFVNEEVGVVADLLLEGIIDAAQLHGSEDAAYIKSLRQKVKDAKIIKAVKVREAQDIIRAAELDCDALLLDTYKPGTLGGTGETFSWDLIDEARKSAGETETNALDGLILGKPWFLAGGLNIDNIEAAANTGAYGLDLSSGIETDGQKDKDKMMEVVRRIRNEQR